MQYKTERQSVLQPQAFKRSNRNTPVQAYGIQTRSERVTSILGCHAGEEKYDGGVRSRLVIKRNACACYRYKTMQICTFKPTWQFAYDLSLGHCSLQRAISPGDRTKTKPCTHLRTHAGASHARYLSDESNHARDLSDENKPLYTTRRTMVRHNERDVHRTKPNRQPKTVGMWASVSSATSAFAATDRREYTKLKTRRNNCCCRYV